MSIIRANRWETVSGNAAGVLYVDTIADLQALPTSELVDGQQVQVKEYHAGTGVGGGVLYWQEGNSENENGGTVFGDYPTGRWVRSTDQIITPYSFGCVDNTECTAEVSKHLNFCVNNSPYSCSIEGGPFHINESITVTGDALESEISGIIRLHVISEIENALNLSTNYKEFTGGFRISSATHNLYRHGVAFRDVSRTTIGSIRTNNAKGFALFYGPGNSNMSSVGKVVATNSSHRNVDASSLSFVEHIGPQNSIGRRAVFDVSNSPDDLKDLLYNNHVGAVINIGGKPSVVISVDKDAETVTLYPGRGDDYDYSQSSILASNGGAVFTIGGDGGQLKISLIDARAVGTAWRSAALYGSVVDRLVAQSCTVSYFNGTAPASIGGFGDYIGYIYHEQVTFRGLISSTAGNCVIAAGAGASIRAWRLAGPNSSRYTDEGASGGNSRLRLLGFSDQYQASPFESYVSTTNRQDISSDVTVVDNGDGTYTVDVPIDRGGSGPRRHIVQGPSNVKLLVLSWSELTSVAARRTIEVLLANVNYTGGGTVSTYSSGGWDYVRISGGNVDLSGGWTRKSININR